MVAQTSSEACGNANSYGSCDKGMCLKYTRTWLEIPSLQPDAISAWNKANVKHPGDRNPPAGAPVFYKGGQYGHIALSMGGGKIRSTDCTSTYDVSTVDLSWCENHWGYPYLGWTEDLNEVKIPYLTGGAPTPEPPEEEDMPLTDDDLTKIAGKVWSHRVADESVGTIMVRLNPGTPGIVAAVRDGVWGKMLPDATTGNEQKASAENQLRYARADSLRAAEYTETTKSASAATATTSAASVTGPVLAIGLAVALVILVVAALVHATGGGGEGLTEAERQVLTAGVGGLLALLGAIVGMRRG
jgi:hypothetical protein